MFATFRCQWRKGGIAAETGKQARLMGARAFSVLPFFHPVVATTLRSPSVRPCQSSAAPWVEHLLTLRLRSPQRASLVGEGLLWSTLHVFRRRFPAHNHRRSRKTTLPMVAHINLPSAHTRQSSSVSTEVNAGRRYFYVAAIKRPQSMPTPGIAGNS